jgi:hypothetical protein
VRKYDNLLRDKVIRKVCLVFFLVISTSACDLQALVSESGLSPAQTPTLASTLTATATLTAVPLPSETPTVPPTETPTIAGVTFLSATVSSDHIYWSACKPDSVTFEAVISNPDQVFDVEIFIRLEDQITGEKTNWDTITSLAYEGDGRFTYTIKAREIPGYTRYQSAWVQYQFVATDKQKKSIARTKVFLDTLTLAPLCI